MALSAKFELDARGTLSLFVDSMNMGHIARFGVVAFIVTSGAIAAAPASKSASRVGASGAPGAGPTAGAAPRAVAVPFGERGIGFDDLGFSPTLRRLLVPAGGTGRIGLIDPDTSVVRSLSLGSPTSFQGGHDAGLTSADASGRHLVVIDRDSLRVEVVDADTAAVIATAKLSGPPDYVRWAADAHEIWVTEPDDERIEVFSFDGHSQLKHLTDIRVPGGPESLILDPLRKKTFTHRWAGSTVVVDVATHVATGTWPNACRGSRGIAFDDEHQILFVGCAEGRLVAIDTKLGGKIIDSIATPAGVDVIAWSGPLRHVYVPGATDAAMAIVGVTPAGRLKVLEVVPTAKGAHCVASDDRGHAWVCDPARGRLLVVTDSHPKS